MLLIVFSLSFQACGEFPRDPLGTLHRVQRGRLRVGLTEHKPWVIRTTGEPAGAEVELVRRFARELGATPEWYWGSEEQHMKALKHYELDLLIGGLTDETPWNKQVGLTRPYFEERIAVGVPASSPVPKELKGQQVAAKKGETAAAYLEKRGALVLRVDDLRETQGAAAIAAPAWQLEQLGLVLTDTELHTERHVMAIAPGENALLKRLEDFLFAQRSQVKTLLQQQEAAGL